MGQALGSLIPLGVAAAVSTVPILVTILILLSDNRNRSALPYLIGWVVGTLFLVTVGTIAASSLPNHGRGSRTRSSARSRSSSASPSSHSASSPSAVVRRARAVRNRSGPMRSVRSVREGPSAWASR